MGGRLQMQLYSAAVVAMTIAALIYVYAAPPESMSVTRDGVPYFTPPVVNPATGKPLDVNALARHFKGAEP